MAPVEYQAFKVELLGLESGTPQEATLHRYLGRSMTTTLKLKQKINSLCALFPVSFNSERTVNILCSASPQCAMLRTKEAKRSALILISNRKISFLTREWNDYSSRAGNVLREATGRKDAATIKIEGDEG